LNKTYKDWKNAKTTVSGNEEGKNELPTGIERQN
jgi:hypothetical protein